MSPLSFKARVGSVLFISTSDSYNPDVLLLSKVRNLVFFVARGRIRPLSTIQDASDWSEW